MTKQTLWILAAAALAPAAASAAGVGTTGAPFLKIGMGARSQGLAGAYSAMADDATAVYWNPAGLAGMTKPQLHADFVKHFQDVSIGQMAYATDLKGHRVGVGVTYLTVPDIEKRGLTDAAGIVPDEGTIDASDLAVSLACAKGNVAPGLLENLDAGAALKVIRSAIGSEDAVAFAVDAGALYRATDKLRLSLAVQNLGTEMKFKSEGDPLPLALKAGAAYKARKDLNVALDLDEQLVDQKLYASIGGEYWIRDAFALRAGYKFGYDTARLGSEAGLGLGVGVKVAGLGLDYAYLPFGDLGASHRFGFWIQF